MSLHRLNLRPLLAVAALILVAGCVAEEPARSGRPGASAFAAGTYRCNDGSALDIRRVSGGVQVTEPDGDITVLPPAPPISRTVSADRVLPWFWRDAPLFS